MIRDVKLTDAEVICNIYNHYVENTIVTFDIDPLTISDFEEKIKSITAEFPFIVYEENGQIIGYAYGSKWRPKYAYRFSVESTIYLDKDHTGKGIGKVLYQELIERLKMQKVHNIFGVISLPNDGSVALHEKFGFKKSAHFAEVGWKFDKWIDVGHWQLVL